MNYENLLLRLSQLSQGGLIYWVNLENRIKISDFKIITNPSERDSEWFLTVIGPDNHPFDIQHPKLKFTSSTWQIRKNGQVMPWFINELPTSIFLLIAQWWMKILAYKAWMASEYKPRYYTGILNEIQNSYIGTS